ncbi:MAG: hypothetical protein ACOYXC_03815 [Candidatus Rifleibacteriota bacterium]
MKIRNILSLMVIIVLVAVSSAWCDVVDELIEIDAKLAQTSQGELAEVADVESQLKDRENEAFKKLLDSKEAIEKFVKLGDKFESGLEKRFVSRMKFAINQENRNDLKAYLDDWTNVWGDGATVRGKKKIAYIYGNEVNLLDGEWRNAPDGKRFWVSNEYPDIILSPAEYKRYAQSAVVVED